MTFKSTIERVANPRLKSPLASQLSGIVGYQDYVTGKARHLSGIVARGRTLTIRLARPDGAFLANLATGAACAVPRDTPADPGGINDIPSAGPYYIASYTPRQQLVLRRNPNYHGDRPHRLDQIVVAIGVDPARALQQIEAGKTDNALDGIPSDAGPRLEAEYGPGSKAAKQGHQRYFVSPVLGARLLHMNTSRPLFSHVRLRRAVNYAIDRPALVAQGLRFANGSPFFAGAPSADYIPASMAGAKNFHLYPVNGPDLRRAKRIAGRVHATAIMYTPNIAPWTQEAQIIRRDLAPLGIDVQVKEFAVGDFFARITRRGEPFDLAVSGYARRPRSLGPLTFDGSTIGHRTTQLSYFDDPAFNRKLQAAEKLSGASRNRAASRLALELERDDAPAAAIGTNASRDFFSARIGCQVYQPPPIPCRSSQPSTTARSAQRQQRPPVLRRPGLHPESSTWWGSCPARTASVRASRLALALQARRRSRGHDRDEREPRLLLGADRLPGLPTPLWHRPRRPVPAEVTRLDCVPVAKIDANFDQLSTHRS